MSATFTTFEKISSTLKINYLSYLFVLIAGILGPLGFAPFQFPGLIILSVTFLYAAILRTSMKQSAILGFIYGMGYFGIGVSWVVISIHDYGHMVYALSGFLTFLFISFLALHPAALCFLFKWLKVDNFPFLSAGTFSALWLLFEFIRSHIFTGFPWLLVGTGLIQTPLKYLAPILGTLGLSFLGVLAACFLVTSQRVQTVRRFAYLTAFIFIIIGPSALNKIQWTTVRNEPISIAGIQSNLSMRDKWDEQLFLQMLRYYEGAIDKQMGNDLIILPESAIPIPVRYIPDYLKRLNAKALKAHSGVIIGNLLPVEDNEDHRLYNGVISLGTAKGTHLKYQLVPFGEYIPRPFLAPNRWLNLPLPDLVPGPYKQPLIEVLGHQFANLICYEVAYPNLLRLQMPEGQWIVSVSDNGWFGKSFASFQQLQMSQMLSVMSGRYQVVVNNDGLSSIIDNQGNIVKSLPAFSAGILKGDIYPAEGTTPWVLWGDLPILIFCSLFIIFILFLRLRYLSQH